MNNVTETAIMNLLAQYEVDIGHEPDIADEDLRKYYAIKIIKLVEGGRDG